jgi:hypothetical protein
MYDILDEMKGLFEFIHFERMVEVVVILGKLRVIGKVI